MGLAPGVNIAKTTFKIPRIGMPIELMAAQIQQSQTLKDEYSDLISKVPKGNPLLPGTQELSNKLNDYFGAISNEVAKAIASGDGYKATNMLKAAKTQVSREFKQGGAAYALVETNKAIAESIKEYKEREVDNDKYTTAHKQYDYDMFLKRIKENPFTYDAATGDYSSVPTIQKTPVYDVNKRLDDVAKSLKNSPDADNVISQLRMAATGMVSDVFVIENIETIKDSRTKAALKSLFSDPALVQELKVRQYSTNKALGRIDENYNLTDEAKATAKEYLTRTYNDYKNYFKEYDKLSVPEKKAVLKARGEYKSNDGSDTVTADFTAADAKFRETLKQADNAYNEQVQAIDGENGNSVAEQVLQRYEANTDAENYFTSLFGIKRTTKNLPTPSSGGGGSSPTKLIANQVRSINTPTGVNDQVVLNKEKTAEAIKAAREATDAGVADWVNTTQEIKFQYAVLQDMFISNLVDTPFTEDQQDERSEYISSVLDKQAKWYEALQFYQFNEALPNEDMVDKFATKYGLDTDEAAELVKVIKDNKIELEDSLIKHHNQIVAYQSAKNLSKIQRTAAIDEMMMEFEASDGEFDKNNYKYDPKKILLTVGGYEFNNINKEDAIDFLVNANRLQEMVDDGASVETILNSDEFNSIPAIKDNLYQYISAKKTAENTASRKNPGAPVVIKASQGDITPSILHNYISNVLNGYSSESDLQANYLPVTFEARKQDYGVGKISQDGLGLIKSGNFRDVATLNTAEFKDYNTNEPIAKGTLDLTNVKEFSIGASVDGKLYYEFSAEYGDKQFAKIRAEVPSKDVSNVTNALIEQSMINYNANKDFGELTNSLKMLTAVEGYGYDIGLGQALSENIQKAQNSKLLTNQGTVTIYNEEEDEVTNYDLQNAYPVVQLDNFVYTQKDNDGNVNSTMGKASIMLEKTGANSYKYRLVFENSAGQFNLNPLIPDGVGFRSSQRDYFTNYSDAANALMIYKNMQFLEAGAGDPEKIDILESVGL
jgi:hypothetical protein